MIARPIIEAANLLGVAVLARLVAPEDFGRYAIALIVLLLAAVPTWAVGYTIVQGEEINSDHLSTGLTLTILMGLAVSGFCFVASYTVVPALFGAETAPLVRLMIPACFINSVNTVQYSLLSRRLEFRRLQSMDMVITLGGTVTSIPLAIAGLNGEAMVLGVVVASTAGYILLCSWIRPPIPNFHLRSARDLLRSGIPAAAGAAGMVGFQNCDNVIVGARLGPLQAGYYFRGYTLAVVYQKKVTQVMQVLGFPVMSRVTTDEERDRLRQRMVHTVTLILFPLLTALAIVAPKFVTWFYGPQWSEAVVPVQILTAGGAAMVVAEAAIVALLGTGRARAVMWWGWGHFLAYAGIVFAIARLGLPAIALAAVGVHTVFMMIAYLQLERGCVRRAIKTLARDVLPAGASCVGLAAVALPVSGLASMVGIPTVPYLLCIAVAGGAGYFLSLRVWFPTELRHLGLLARRVLPSRAQRLIGRFAVRREPQSAS
jgi:PST family polysaccharide transporter